MKKSQLLLQYSLSSLDFYLTESQYICMKGLEFTIRIITCIILIAFTANILHETTDVQKAIKLGSAAGTTLLAAFSLFCPIDALKSLLSFLLKQDTTPNNDNSNSENQTNNQTGNQINLNVHGNINGNISPTYNATIAEESRNASTQRVPSIQNLEEVPNNTFSGNIADLERETDSAATNNE